MHRLSLTGTATQLNAILTMSPALRLAESIGRYLGDVTLMFGSDLALVSCSPYAAASVRCPAEIFHLLSCPWMNASGFRLACTLKGST